MDAVSQFLDMGGYAGFVWPAYGIAAIVLVGLLVISRRERKAARPGPVQCRPCVLDMGHER